MKVTVGDILKLTVRKRALYAVTEVRENDSLLRRVNADYTDAGDKSTFRLPNDSPIVEKIVGHVNGKTTSQTPPTKTPSASPFVKKASEMMNNNYLKYMESGAIAVLKELVNAYLPENLVCDGEATQTQMRKMKAELDRKWKAMELYFNHSITNDLT